MPILILLGMGGTGLPASSGSYALTGSNANFLTGSVGTGYVLTGFSATFTVAASAFGAEAGSYAVTGTAAAFKTGLTAGASTYTLTGGSATLPRTLAAAAGSYNITGADAGFSSSTVTGYMLTGHGATLRFTQAVGAATYTLVETTVAVPTTWDGSTATNTALTNGDLTATHTNATSNSGVRSTAYKTSGKYYFELTTGATVASADTIGLLISSGTYTNYVTSKTNCMACSAGSGNINSNNASTGKTIATLITGGPHVVGIAVDLDARLGWFRKNAGNWNGDAAANPATGAGGVALASSVSFSPAVGFNALNSSWIANFGATAFANAAPAGFAAGWTAEGSATRFILGHTAATSSYVLTGVDATFVVIAASGDYTLFCGSGSYTLTGSDVAFPGLEVLPPVQPSPGEGSGYTGAWSGPKRRKRKRDEIEELIDAVIQAPPQIPPQTPQIPQPPPPALIDMTAKMQAVGLTPPQRRTVKRAIVSDDEDDDEEAIELLLNLLS